MTKAVLKTVIVIVIVVAAAVIFAEYKQISQKYIQLRKEHEDVINKKQKLKEDVKNLSQLKEELEGKVTILDTQLQKKEIELKEAKNQISALKEEKQTMHSGYQQKLIALKEGISRLEEEILDLRLKKVELDARLHSISELEKALKQAREKQAIAKKRLQQRLDEIMLEIGNNGYLVRDGKPTITAEKRGLQKEIKVEILPPENNIQ
jgi:chromosome segregation ATPase